MRNKRLYICLPFIFLTVVCGCSNSGDKRQETTAETDSTKSDTITYTVRVINETDEDCDSAKQKDCEIVNIRYHVFDGHPSLNDSVSSRILAIYPFEQPASSIDEQVKGFVRDYKDFKKEPYAQGRQYELISSTRVLRNSAALLTLQLDSYTYTGGAHGASMTLFINYDVGNRKVLSLDDVMKDNYRDSLNQVAELIFKKNEGLRADAPIDSNSYFFTDHRFSINNNFVFTTEGIKFLYNQYEIKPYAAGKTELLVPYAKIKSLIKPGSVLQPFLD